MPKARSPRFTLPKSRRLLRTSEYRTVFGRNRQTSNRQFRVLARFKQPQAPPRLGVVVSRRVSRSAVVRNRIKRQVRECFRQRQAELAGCDLVVIALKASEGMPKAILRESLEKLLQQVARQCKKR